jgi:hypothetical protein
MKGGTYLQLLPKEQSCQFVDEGSNSWKEASLKQD